MACLVVASIVMFGDLTVGIFHVDVVETKILKENRVFLAKW